MLCIILCVIIYLALLNISVEYFCRIFLQNISLEYFCRIFTKKKLNYEIISCVHIISYISHEYLQLRYVVDSWIKYIIKVKAVSTRESKETGHYICYKFVDGNLLRFDDTLVNRVEMQEQYKINLIVYQRYDVDAFPWNIDIGFLTHLNELGYSLRRSTRGQGFSVRHKVKPYINQTVSSIGMDESEEAGTVDNTSERPIDMSIPKSLPVQNGSDANNNKESSSTTYDKDQSHNLIQGSEEDSASTVAVTEKSVNSVNISLPVSIPLINAIDGNDINNTNVTQSDTIDTNEMEVSEDVDANGENETSKEDGQGSVIKEVVKEANIQAAITNSDGDNSKCANGEMDTISPPVSMDVDQSEEHLTDTNNSVPEMQNNDLPNISAKESNPSEEHTESSGNVEISEFEEMVDYGEDSSTDERSDKSEQEVAEKPKPKPDWSLRPPLITPTNKKQRSENEKLRRSSRKIPLPKIKPQRVQPRR